MLIYVSFDGDHIGRMVGRARLADDEEAVRRISSAIDRGNQIWKSWAEMKGGSIISLGGDEGSLHVPADALEELADIREQYAKAVEAPVSVGVGMKLSEADKALIAAKVQGGDRILFFTEEVDKIVEDARKQGEKTEEAKIADEYLTKAAPAMNPGAFSGATRPSAPTVDAPVATQGDHEEGQVIGDVVNGEDAPAPAEMTHAGKDFEQMLHDEAWKGEESDMADSARSHSNMEQVKADLVQALTQLKAQGPVLEQVKQVAPGAYKAMMGLARTVIGLAKELTPPKPLAKAEAGEHDKVGKLVDAVRDAHKGPSRGVVDTEHCQKGDCYEQAEALYHLLGGTGSDYRPHFLHHKGMGPHWFLRNGEGRVLDPMADAHSEPLPYRQGLPANFLADVPSPGAQAVIDEILGFNHDQPLEKADKPKRLPRGFLDSFKHVEAHVRGNDPHSGTIRSAGRFGLNQIRPENYYWPEKPLAIDVHHEALDPRDPASPDDVQRYADQMRAGSEPPAIFGVYNPRGEFVNVLDGAHRLAAKQVAGQAQIGAYIGLPKELAGTGHWLEKLKPHESQKAKAPAKAKPAPKAAKMKKDELEKAKLPMPGAPAHHHVTLPAGSVLGNKIKVAHSDGKESWKQVGSGMITSQDPSHHPVSARNPNSK